MGEQLARILAPLRQFWEGLSLRAKRITIAAAALILIAALVLSIWLNSEEYVAIFTELPEYEQTEVMAQLNDMGVNVRFDDAGRIMVPKKQQAAVRMQLATAGYPKNGLNYWAEEENESVLTTDYSRRQAYYRGLQERLGAFIKSLDGVRDAFVIVTPPDEKVFSLDEEAPPGASLIIHMQEGRSLTSTQITGIRNIVVTSIKGLTAENVSMVDGFGRDLLGDSSFGAGGAGLDFKRQYENDIRQKIFSILTGPYAYEDLRVAVSAVVNTNPSYTTRRNYIPSPDGDNRGVVSHEANSSESYRSTESDAGVPGTDSNSEIPRYPTGGLSGESESSAADAETDYKVSEENFATVSETPTVESVTVAVSVNKAAFAPGEEARLIDLVARTANTLPENVVIYNTEFYSEAPPEEEPEAEGMNRYLLFGIIAGAVLLIALVVLLLLMRRRKKAAEALAAEEAAAAEAAAAAMIEYDEEGRPIPQAETDIGPITPMRDKRREEIQEFARQNPEITAQMIKTLLKTEEG
ncbi:MAG: flagellar M-ring protein FliF [Clostridiales Family XIII bacterium]|jgi:flagellar M-ring protein FliF|nr:flagellar M-ring protein FliF [Clostridiales Family XIII bacterium]